MPAKKKVLKMTDEKKVARLNPPAVPRLNPTAVQRQASDPDVSVWVTASAGTGKTKVLTDRILRLMLKGAAPDEILCLTFTRAGASVMTNRLRDELSLWATCDDAILQKKLTGLSGRKPPPETMLRARALFGEFLDAQGGMKIQTIHSFAQSLLKKFPIESGIPPYFDVMDDQTASEALRQAQINVLRDLHNAPHSALAKAVNMITPEVAEDDFVGLMSELTYRRGELLSIFEKHGGLEGSIDAIYQYLNAPQGLNAKALNEQLNSDTGINGVAPDSAGLKAAAQILANGTAVEKEKALLLQDYLEHPEKRAELFWDYVGLFLTAEKEVRKRLTTKATSAAEDVMAAEAQRLRDGIDFIQTVNVARGTESLLRLTDAVLANYKEIKRSLNILDYDDLVHQANVMMRQDNAASWVLQKLPGNLKHILVDEAQDTNPDQWQLIVSIAKEFFTNPARRKNGGNTIFVVGDEKQSIFSFQRADPEKFGDYKKYFESLVKSGRGKWRDVKMEIAFRSSPAITSAVDAVFANPLASDGLFFKDDKEHIVKHQSFRRGQAGLVEVMPMIRPEEQTEPSPWALPLHMEKPSDPAMVLAEQIADKIEGWMDTGERLESRNRVISPADIMILVRRRSAFVDHMIRALKKRDIPVAGADRVSLRDQIIVMDMMALGDVALFPQDDYKLACVLKSPLIGMTDAQLETLAVGRKNTLWESLRDNAATDNTDRIFKDAFAYLSVIHEQLGMQRPYEFYSSVLTAPCPAHTSSGMLGFYSRLGVDAEDAAVEFMNAVERFEKNHTPALQGFLAWLEAGEAEVKREVSVAADNPRVHIMTAHGAKGLEAPIVFLPDTTGVPSDNTRARPKFLWPEGDRTIPLWVPRSDLESRIYTQERVREEQKLDREYRRLLYVAMTRAADRLYIYGAQNGKTVNPESWYALIEQGLQDKFNGAAATAQFTAPQTARPVKDGVMPPKKVKKLGIPQWARTAPTAVTNLTAHFTPSAHHGQAATGKGANDNAVVASPLDETPEQETRQTARDLGTIIHSLLEYLPMLDAAEQAAAARKYVAQPVWNLTKYRQQKTVKQVMAVLNDPEFSALFGARSRAEISIGGFVEKDGRKQSFSAQIDRLVVEDQTVLIVDYKNNRRVPEDISQVSHDYIVQMAAYKMAVEQIYPDKEVKCALLYTQEALLIPLPAEKLARAIARIGLALYDDTAFKRAGGAKPS